MVGNTSCRTQDRHGTKHRSRHFQLPRMEPERRPVDKTPTGHALPRKLAPRSDGRKENQGQVARRRQRREGR